MPIKSSLIGVVLAMMPALRGGIGQTLNDAHQQGRLTSAVSSAAKSGLTGAGYGMDTWLVSTITAHIAPYIFDKSSLQSALDMFFAQLDKPLLEDLTRDISDEDIASLGSTCLSSTFF